MNLAAALGLSGLRVLVIDLDPQGFLTRMMGVSEPEPERSSLLLFNPETDLDSLPIIPLSSFDVLPSSPALSTAIRKLNKPSDVLWLREYTSKDRADYDIVLIDTAAAVTVYSLNALVASQHMLIPVLPEYQPVVGAEQSFQTALVVRKKLNPGLYRPRFLFTMVDARKRNHFMYRRYLRDKYEDLVMSSVIRTSTSLSVTHQDGRTVFETSPQARGSIDYANATDELLRFIKIPAEPVETRPRQPVLPSVETIDAALPS